MCADTHLTSNDPLEAYLLDGGFVREWCRRTLAATEASAGGALRSDAALRTYLDRPGLLRDLANAGTMVSVLRALDRIRGGGGTATGTTDG